MPDDQTTGDHSAAASARGDADPAQRGASGPARNFLLKRQNKSGGQKTGVQSRAPAQPFSTPSAPASALPAGTAFQLETLFAMRRGRRRGFALRLGLFVALPALTVWFYTALIATPRYVCNFEVTYQAYQPNTTIGGTLTPSVIGSSVEDSIDYGTIIYEYIRSPALAAQVDQALKLREQFSDRKIDFLSRLGSNADQAGFLDYWRKHVVVSEGFGGYLTIQVQGFDPQKTLQLAQTINADADSMIDGLTARARAAEVQSATDQLNAAALTLRQADAALTSFRNAHGDLDPGFDATQLATVAGTLEAQLAALRAQLTQAQANLQPGASQIVQLDLQINGVESQIQAERQRLAANGGQASYSDIVATYDDLLANQQSASNAYQLTLQGLEMARADAASKQNYVVDFVPPILPDRPALPDPLVSSFETLLACLTAYGIVSLLLAAFRDQAGL
jgi:capsular polysaccharide transport system permease protein